MLHAVWCCLVSCDAHAAGTGLDPVSPQWHEPAPVPARADWRDTVLDVRKLGAKGDGVTIDHTVIAAAFANAAASSGHTGSTVTVALPAPGVYLVDQPLRWNASNSVLSIEQGATLRYQWDKQLKFAQSQVWQPQWGRSYKTMLTVGPSPGEPPLENVTLSGGELVDCAGYMWWPFVYHMMRPAPARPYMFGVSSVAGLTIANLTVLNPPAITFNGPCGCHGVEMVGLNITAAWLKPEEFYSKDHSPVFAQWRRKAPVTRDILVENVRIFRGTCLVAIFIAFAAGALDCLSLTTATVAFCRNGCQH